jgi:hypothetical protein
MAGPGIAGFLYTYLGYFKSFFCFVVFIGVSGLLCLFFIPNSINRSCRDDEQSEDEAKKDDPEKIKLAEKNNISYIKFFMDRRTIFSLITCSYCCFLFQFSSSFFVTVLEYEKKVPI